MTSPSPPSDIEIHEGVPLARYTYLRIGGPAQYFATPNDLVELERLMLWARAAGLPMRIIGGGSNLLVSDEGVGGLVVSLRRACGGMQFNGPRVTAGAAVMLPALARAAAERGLGGLEFAVGIPGSVGGALQTNAGIGDGRCIGPLVQEVEIFGGRGFQTLSRYEIRFEYRQSSLRGAGVMVVGATLLLEPRDSEEIQAGMRRLLEARAATQPTAEPNAGSMFRNAEGDFAGRLIEAAGCKGLGEGGVRVSERHANFFVHDGTGRASDVVALMGEVQRRVLEMHGIWLTPEIVWWGDGPIPAPFVGAVPGAELSS